MKKTDIHLTIIVVNKRSKKRYRNGMNKTMHKAAKKKKKKHISCERSFYQSKQGQREVRQTFLARFALYGGPAA